MFAQFVEGLRLAQSAAASNFWGLGCPFYCTEFSAGSILAAALLGGIVGFGLGFWSAIALYTWVTGGDLPAARTEERGSEEPLGRGRLRLRGYVHGR